MKRVLLCLVALVLTGGAAYAHAGMLDASHHDMAYVSLTPSTTHVGAGETFQLSLDIDTSVGLMGWNLDLYQSIDGLDLLGVTLGDRWLPLSADFGFNDMYGHGLGGFSPEAPAPFGDLHLATLTFAPKPGFMGEVTISTGDSDGLHFASCYPPCVDFGCATVSVSCVPEPSSAVLASLGCMLCGSMMMLRKRGR